MVRAVADVIKEEAQKEIDAEDRRRAIDKMKIQIRAKRGRSIWRKLFPWKLVKVE